MKEISIEEKAKRYDEALEKARQLCVYPTSKPFISDLQDLFPELAESENERIRNFLIKQANSVLDSITDDDEEVSDWKSALAWLKKQGNLMKALQISNAEIGELIEKNYYLKEQLEKQGEHKPTDKIKPKFKVGDIVKHKDNPHLTYILKRFTDDGDYEFHAIGKDGNEGCTCFSVVKYQDEWELVEEPASEDLEKIVEEIVEPIILNAYGTKELARRLRNTICGISISEDLGEYINELSKQFPEVSFVKLSRIAVRVAKWQKEKLWKPADGDNLPEIDREVVVLIKYNAQRNIHDEEYPTYRVGFGHRPNPDGWDGKDIDTNEVTHYTPKLYDKGGWNAPDIVYWLDIELPKEIEL